MKKIFFTGILTVAVFSCTLFAQNHVNVPKVVKEAFATKFPHASAVTWETEKGNYEANWGGKSGEDNSVLYSPSGKFIELDKAIPVNQLPANSLSYLKSHYSSDIKEAAIVTDANGKITYEAEVAHKTIVFDEHGNFVKGQKD